MCDIMLYLLKMDDDNLLTGNRSWELKMWKYGTGYINETLGDPPVSFDDLEPVVKSSMLKSVP